MKIGISKFVKTLISRKYINTSIKVNLRNKETKSLMKNIVCLLISLQHLLEGSSKFRLIYLIPINQFISNSK